MKIRKTVLTASLAALFGAGVAATPKADETMRLEWVIQGQFAGPIVAMDKGYYAEAGVELELLPAGPDIKPAVTVAQGADTFGLGHPNQIIAARSNGVPLVMVMQFGQKSSTTYVARKESGIERVEDMPGHSVGLWFGGDEHEFLAMLDAAGVSTDDVQIISQGFDIISWLNGEYEVMQVTRFNELLQVYDNGFSRDDLVLLDPEGYGVALVSGGLFTTEDVINENPDVVQAVVEAHHARMAGCARRPRGGGPDRPQVQRRAHPRKPGRPDQGDGRSHLCRPDPRRRVRQVGSRRLGNLPEGDPRCRGGRFVDRSRRRLHQQVLGSGPGGVQDGLMCDVEPGAAAPAARVAGRGRRGIGEG